MVKRKNELHTPTLLKTLSEYYYGDMNRIERIRPYLEKRSNISLRLIDWYVGVYTKIYPVLLYDGTFDISNSHSLHLKNYSKRLFDPFQRSEQIRFFVSEDDHITTTISQLNFFKWALTTGVLDHIEENSEKIQELFQEKKDLKPPRKTKQSKKRIKNQQRGELSDSKPL